MKLKSFTEFNCPLAQALSVIGEHWSLLIIRDAFFGLRKFDHFHKSLGISRNILSDRLKKLVEAGILAKSEGSGHAEYYLTEKGEALQPILLAMSQWGETYIPNPDGKRVIFVDSKHGKPIQKISVFSEDGVQLTPHDISAKLGPGITNSDALAARLNLEEATKIGLLGPEPHSTNDVDKALD